MLYKHSQGLPSLKLNHQHICIYIYKSYFYKINIIDLTCILRNFILKKLFKAKKNAGPKSEPAVKIAIIWKMICLILTSIFIFPKLVFGVKLSIKKNPALLLSSGIFSLSESFFILILVRIWIQSHLIIITIKFSIQDNP